ncbi:MAG: hypothetical protein H0T42_09000 [Deltaproteobacteria bacterium]|nr:hypothetical protein [Deltaproteobacteria bacterium]
MGRDRACHALLLALTLAGCDRAPANEPPPPTATPSSGPIKVVVPTEAAPIVQPPPAPPEPAPVEPAPRIGSTDARADAKAKPIAREAKGGPYAQATAGTEKPPAPPAKSSTPKVLVSEKLFEIVLSPLAPCAPATPCEAHLVVTALDGYKFNVEYPTKFAVQPSPAVTVEGTGTVTILARTSARVTVKFRAAASGAAPITGALKLSVCTDDVCEIAAPVVSFDVPVS